LHLSFYFAVQKPLQKVHRERIGKHGVAVFPV